LNVDRIIAALPGIEVQEGLKETSDTALQGPPLADDYSWAKSVTLQPCFVRPRCWVI